MAQPFCDYKSRHRLQPRCHSLDGCGPLLTSGGAASQSSAGEPPQPGLWRKDAFLRRPAFKARSLFDTEQPAKQHAIQAGGQIVNQLHPEQVDELALLAPDRARQTFAPTSWLERTAWPFCLERALTYAARCSCSATSANKHCELSNTLQYMWQNGKVFHHAHLLKQAQHCRIAPTHLLQPALAQPSA